MWPVVLDSWLAWNVQFEAYIPYMYLDDAKPDVGGPFVTTAVGILIDPVGMAVGLPWVHKDGTPATSAEIQMEWHRVKAMTAYSRFGGGSDFFSKSAQLHLSADGIKQAVMRKLVLNEQILSQAFKGWATYPAPAQMAIGSMAWSMGAGFWVKFPIFSGHVTARNWGACAGLPGDASANPALRGSSWEMNNHLPGPNPANRGIHPRNLANRRLFFQAAAVELGHLDPSTLDLG